MQRSCQSAAGRRRQSQTTLTPSLPGAVRHGRTCTGTRYIPVTAVRTGWCLISSLVLAPAIALLNRNTSQAPALTREKTFLSSSQDCKGSKTLIQSGLRCWDPCRPDLSSTDSTAGRLSGRERHASGRERQHHSSVRWTCTDLHILTGLLLPWTYKGPHRPTFISHLPPMTFTMYLGDSNRDRH